MKIGYFITQFPYNNLYNKSYFIRGAENAAYNLADNLSKKKHIVSVFTTSVDSKDDIEKFGNFIAYRYGTNFKIASGRFSLGILREPIRHPLDIVHAHLSVPIGCVAGMGCSRRKNLPFVITYHGDLIENMGHMLRRSCTHLYNKHILDKILSYANCIIVPSKYYIDESKFLRNYKDKIIEIPNGIDPNRFELFYSKERCRQELGLPLHSEIILFLGTLNSQKGINNLLNAMKIILKDIPTAKLVIVGDGPERNTLERLTIKFGIEESVKFTGFVDEHIKVYYYNASDIFVLPSAMGTEVFPITLLEASASGLPLVASDSETLKCIIKGGYNGFFAKKGSEKSLADKIVYILKNEQILIDFGKNARKEVAKYSWEKIATTTEEVYLDLIKGQI